VAGKYREGRFNSGAKRFFIYGSNCVFGSKTFDEVIKYLTTKELSQDLSKSARYKFKTKCEKFFLISGELHISEDGKMKKHFPSFNENAAYQAVKYQKISLI
jgi:hypothetical protein